MSQNQHPAHPGPQNNNQNRYSVSNRSMQPKPSANGNRTPQQPRVERRQNPSQGPPSVFKNSTNNLVHPANSNGSFVAQGTPWQEAHPDQRSYHTPTPSRGNNQSLSSSGGSTSSSGQRPGHFYPTQEYMDQTYGNIANPAYEQQSLLDHERGGTSFESPHQSVGRPSNAQVMGPFDPEYAMLAPRSRSSSPVDGLELAIAKGGDGGSGSEEEMAVVLRQDQQQEVTALVQQEEDRARRAADGQPDGQPPAKKQKQAPVTAVTASLAEKAGKKFGMLYCLWATEDEIFSGDGEETEPEPFSVKDLRRRAHWVQKGVHDLRASTPKSWIEGWGTDKYKKDFIRGMSTIRTDLRGLIQPRPSIFGINDTKTWSKPGARAAMPELVALIKNTYFLSDPDGDESPAGRLARNFRHPALVQILIRVFHGETALNAGAPSNKAHKTRAKQWAPLNVDYRVVVTAATMARSQFDFLIQDSDYCQQARLVLVQADLDSSPEIQEYYWKTIRALMKMKKTAGSQGLVVQLEKDVNDALWLSPPDEDEDTEDEEDRLFEEALDAV